MQWKTHLEEEVTRMEAWNTEKERYELNQLGDGLFTYILKEEEGAPEPTHQLCANCYNIHNKKSILLMETRNPGMAQVLFCQNCGLNVYVFGHWHKDHGRPGQSRSMR